MMISFISVLHIADLIFDKNLLLLRAYRSFAFTETCDYTTHAGFIIILDPVVLDPPRGVTVLLTVVA